jgi:hypothetical protein
MLLGARSASAVRGPGRHATVGTRPMATPNSTVTVGWWRLLLAAATGILAVLLGAGTAAAASASTNYDAATYTYVAPGGGVIAHSATVVRRSPLPTSARAPAWPTIASPQGGVAADTEAVLVEGAGSGTRALNLRPNAADGTAAGLVDTRGEWFSGR